MALQAWWQVATPHKDIREKNFSEAIFAADLGDVIGGNAPDQYQDPRLFFSKTYLTGGLSNLVNNALSRVVHGRGDPVIQLQTPFGGGKTHSLLCLYHIGKSFGDISHLPQLKEIEATFPEFKGVRVAAFAGTTADPVAGKTPWGEIAYQLGCYDIVKEHDQRRVAPGKEVVKKVLEKSGPCIILIDELLQYIIKASRIEKLEKITHGQTLAFLQELTEAVSVSEKCLLVLALPASILEQYDEEAEKALAQIMKVSGRVESIYVPVEGMEIYEVIRKRLLDDYGDLRIHKEVAESYFKLYQSLGSDAPNEVKDVLYREKIEKAYPFHPELIDVLYERWGSFPTFQRTRGVLRLLARVIGDLYEKKINSPLIHSSLVNLSSQELRREFLKHIGNEYDSIISADITGKAPRLDQEMGSEYEKYNLAKGLATSTFLYSFSGGERKGITLPWLRVALLREGIPSTIVGDASSKLEESLWYYHAEKRHYSFKNQPNLNRVVIDKEETIEPWQITDEIKDQLEPLIRGSASLAVYRWPESPSDIPDNKRLKLAIIDPSYRHGHTDTEQLVLDIAKKSGIASRVYMNSMFFVAADEDAYLKLEHMARRFLALKAISTDRNLSLTANAQEEINEKLKEKKKDMPSQVLHVYRNVGWYGNGEITWRDMGMPTAGESVSLTIRVFQFLKDEERILTNITPKLILAKAFGDSDQEKDVQSCHDLFLMTPGLPCLESEPVFYNAIRSGVVNYLIGLRQGNKLYYGDAPAEVLGEGIIVRPEIAKAEIEKEKILTESRSGEGFSDWGDSGDQGAGETRETEEDTDQKDKTSAGSRSVKEIYIKADIPWDKLSQLPGGVFLPLKNAGAEPILTMLIRARSEAGFDRTTLDSKVRETLQQIGASIEIFEEK